MVIKVGPHNRISLPQLFLKMIIMKNRVKTTFGNIHTRGKIISSMEKK